MDFSEDILEEVRKKGTKKSNFERIQFEKNINNFNWIHCIISDKLFIYSSYV
jgi:hypothetical protein